MEPNSTTIAEAQRWLTIAVKLLMGRDLVGSKTFAIRARESDPRLEFADQILAVVDTLLAGEKRINNQPDWYAILQLVRGTHDSDSELIAAQYRRLALLLNPHRNKLPFADQAFKLVTDAWSVLSNPSRKSMYDNELNFQPVVNLFGSSREPERHEPPPRFRPPQTLLNPFELNREQEHHEQPPPPPPPPPRFKPPQHHHQHQQQLLPIPPQEHHHHQQQQQQRQQETLRKSPRKSVGNMTEEIVEEESESPMNDDNNVDESSSFWTACPYCYNMYEYPRVYAECTLRCQNCRRAFQAVKVQSPPPIFDGKEAYFCCWGFFPIGVSAQKNKGGASNWTPFSPIFALPKNVTVGGAKNPKPRKSWVYIDEDQDAFDFSEPSDDSDDDWRRAKRRKKVRSAKGKSSAGRYVTRNMKQLQGDKAKNVKGGGSGENLRDGLTQEGVGVPNVSVAETSKKAVSHNTRRQSGRAAKELGKLDLNVEFSNEVEEPAPGMSEGNGAGNREEDNIEGIGFFEGLDEFLSSLPILVGDDKVKAA